MSPKEVLIVLLRRALEHAEGDIKEQLKATLVWVESLPDGRVPF